MTDLAVVIVSWNVRDLLRACLRAACADLAVSGLAGDVWVVDNASSDGSAEMVAQEFPQVQLIACADNPGFAGGNNRAMRAMGFAEREPAAGRRAPEVPGEQLADRSNPAPLYVGANLVFAPEEAPHHAPAPGARLPAPDALPRYVLLLNPDTEIRPGALRALYDCLEATPRAGVAGARLVYGDGSFQHSAFRFPRLAQLALDLFPLPGPLARLYETRLNGRYPRAWYAAGRPFAVDHPLGAALLVRAAAIAQAGLLDESYGMYCEEIDWCLRLRAAGWRSYCVPRAEIVHHSGQSTRQMPARSLVQLWTSRYKLYARHYDPLTVGLARAIVQAGVAWRRRHEPRAEIRAAYDAIARAWRGGRGRATDEATA